VLAVGRAPTIFQNDWFCTRMRGWELRKKGEKKNYSWYSTQAPGRMAQTPQAGTGDSVSQFRRSRCSTLFNCNSYFPVGGQFSTITAIFPWVDKGCDKKRHMFFGKDVTKNVTSQNNKIHVRERHILPRNVTNGTRDIFCHQQM